MVTDTVFRSTCPIHATLQLVGDSWSLLIVRDIVYFGKHTYGEFVASDEKIARNILSNRLGRLVAAGILKKSAHPTDKRKDMYTMTEKGLDLIPLLFDMALWGAAHVPAREVPDAWLVELRERREVAVRRTKEAVRRGRSVFVGEGCVFTGAPLL